MVRACELSAVASETSRADLAPDFARLLAYSKVVEWYHRERTVIPMRYGCILDTVPDIRRLLEDHQREYLQLLGELDGHAEMSAQVALDEPRSFTSLRTKLAPQPLARLTGRPHNRPGLAYLAERSSYYACREDFDQRCEEIRRSICERAEGTFTRCAAEYSERGGKGVLASKRK
jgi:Gas vesicle synthesis protein GvpL/GvpF